ncbi:hypothetical protein Kfla_4194 [Kribbella flavida DSM 17836]|uniref:Uncharacterized protein n=1 Tax=Kribbella flavida (strain DSM 17836 / JCM 10339 / NBRC 14399) TaxID=479435 RepID=D2PTV4_KRIFD|nr:hypothetical protein Kfla_4194 [Kribbella flavida DSM 17836]
MLLRLWLSGRPSGLAIRDVGLWGARIADWSAETTDQSEACEVAIGAGVAAVVFALLGYRTLTRATRPGRGVSSTAGTGPGVVS